MTTPPAAPQLSADERKTLERMRNDADGDERAAIRSALAVIDAQARNLDAMERTLVERNLSAAQPQQT